MALLLTVSAARIADIALTDGTTRTSINVDLPGRAGAEPGSPSRRRSRGSACRSRSACRASLILVLNALPDAARRDARGHARRVRRVELGRRPLYRGYGPALVHALRRTSHLVERPTIRG